MRRIHFTVSPPPPFRLDLTAWALQRRPVNRMDVWDGETYSRVLAQHGRAVFLEVRQSGSAHSPRLSITATSEHRVPRDQEALGGALDRLLGLCVDLKPFYRLAQADPQLGPLARQYLGLKPPRFPSVFEAIINGIACQQLSLHVGLTLLNRLAAKSGLPFETPSGIRYSFPDSESLRTLPVRSFRLLGFSGNKALGIKNVSSKIHDRAFLPETLAGETRDEAIARLLKLKGIGRWTAEYVLLRGLGRTDLFPGDDIGAQNLLRTWLKLRGELDYARVNATLARWKPFAGLLYFHLLLDRLEKNGNLASAAPFSKAA